MSPKLTFTDRLNILFNNKPGGGSHKTTVSSGGGKTLPRAKDKPDTKNSHSKGATSSMIAPSRSCCCGWAL